MSNVLLIYPPIDAPVPVKSTLLGLGYLASVLRQRGHYVSIYDFFGREKSVIDFKQFDVIGVSAMFTNFEDGIHKLLNMIKQYNKEKHLIVGGAHASTFPETMMEFADTVVVGEGEEVICDIVENRRTGIIRADRIQNLDKLPMPAWDLMIPDMNEMNRLSRKSPFLMRRPLAHIITSRGCPNNCTFCAVKVTWGRQWIARSAKNVVDEIEYLYKLGFREIHFNDDNCSVDKLRLHLICDEILKRNIKIKIACLTGIHIMTLDKPLLKHIKQAGFYRLCFGIETGNQELQAKIKKNIDLDKARQIIKDANDLGFWTSATFIMGFPQDCEENDTTKLDTLRFPIKANLDFPIYFQWQLQPKTELYIETMNSRKLIFKPNHLQPLISWGYNEFIKYKIHSLTTYKNLFKKIHSFEDLKYTLGLIVLVLKLWWKNMPTNENVRGR